MNCNSPDMSKVPGGWLTDTSVPLLACKAAPETIEIASNVFRVKNFLSRRSTDAFNAMMKTAPALAPVSIQGMQTITDNTIGSWRTTMFNEAIAQNLTDLFEHVDFPKTLLCDDFFPTDWHQGNRNRRLWEYSHVSPMCRVMRYLKGGTHFCHYDAGFLDPQDDGRRTLMSIVLYLSTNKTGATRVIQDKQGGLKIWDRNHDDWSREVRPDEVIAESYPVAGDVRIFPHRVAHDVQKYDGAEGERVVMRGDLFYKAR